MKNLLAAATVLVVSTASSAQTGPPSCMFADPEGYDAGQLAFGLAIGDLDGDLDVDIVVTAGHFLGYASVFLNDGNGRAIIRRGPARSGRLSTSTSRGRSSSMYRHRIRTG
jgi:hypothetical protein